MADLLSPESGKFHAIGVCGAVCHDRTCCDVDGGRTGIYGDVAEGFARWRHGLRRHWPDRYRGGVHWDGKLARALPQCGICVSDERRGWRGREEGRWPHTRGVGVWPYLRRICRRDWASADPLCGTSAAHVRDDSCGQSGGNGAALYVLHCLWRLAVLGLVYGGNWIRRAAYSSALGKSGLLGELLVGLGLIIALLFVLIAHADLLNPLLNLIDEQIFNKPLSASFYERSHWNTTAWDALASTWGLGIGFGSTRTSNWFASVISNTGLIGAAFMGVFLLQIFARRSISRTALSTELLSALKLSLVPALVMAGVNSPGPDFGLWIGVVFGAITGIAALRPVPSLIGRVAADRSMTARTGGRRAIGSRAFGRFPLPKPYQDSGPDKPAPRPSFRT